MKQYSFPGVIAQPGARRGGRTWRDTSVTHTFGERVLLAFIVGIPLLYGCSIALAWNHVGPRDLDQFMVFHEVQLWNATLFGFAKQWTPVLCSGVSLAGEPQVPLLSLSMIIAYALGPLRGLQCAMLLYLVIGWTGAYLYAGLWLSNARSRALAAALFIGNGFFVCRLAYGHMDFLPFLSLPLALWALHDVLNTRHASLTQRSGHIALLALFMGAGMSVAIDGSPVAIIHLLLWIVLYAVALSVVARSPLPAVMLLAAIAIATFLSAGYSWPMLAAQAEFPRRTADTFTNPLALLWFAMLPVRGKLITPATGNGHELSVFIGPVVGYALWRFRSVLLASLPKSLKWPLLIVSLVSVWLGMGSLRVMHVPVALSPFDWLRPLPGFRSLWVTGRFWGFLALPLSLLGAAALVQFVSSDIPERSKKIALSCALVLQFGFQIVTFYSLWSGGHSYRAITPVRFKAAGETIRYARCTSQHYQGEFIGPTQGVVNCYDNDDFIRVQFAPDAPFVKSILDDSGRPIDAPLRARFMSWDRIRIDMDTINASLPFTVVFNQAYSSHWRSPQCIVTKQAEGFLSAHCTASASARHIDLMFEDRLSTRAAQVSIAAWKIWGVLLAALSLLRGTHYLAARYGRQQEIDSQPTSG